MVVTAHRPWLDVTMGDQETKDALVIERRHAMVMLGSIHFADPRRGFREALTGVT